MHARHRREPMGQEQSNTKFPSCAMSLAVLRRLQWRIADYAAFLPFFPGFFLGVGGAASSVGTADHWATRTPPLAIAFRTPPPTGFVTRHGPDRCRDCGSHTGRSSGGTVRSTSRGRDTESKWRRQYARPRRSVRELPLLEIAVKERPSPIRLRRVPFEQRSPTAALHRR